MRNRSVRKKTAKDRLLEKAETLFALNGFYGTHIRDITGAARCSGSAVNYYFGSKEMLFLSVFQKCWRETLADVRKTLEETFATQADVCPAESVPTPDVVQSVAAVFERKDKIKRFFEEIGLTEPVCVL